jgi:dTDP-4-dehydrorhamnose reductase
MNIALIGASGMLGSDFRLLLANTSHKVFCFASNANPNNKIQSIDITSLQSIEESLSPVSPEIIINCAAYTQVDLCETEKKRASLVNALGPENLSIFSSKNSIPLIHFSTDYVFDGKKKGPYVEDDPTNPINAYGESKLRGELAIKKHCSKYYLFRIQWLYGKNGPNFIKTIANLAKTKKALNIVSDQWGSPTWTKEVVASVLNFIEISPPYGTYHLSNQGHTNWFDFANFFLQELNISCKINPIKSEKYPTPAKRQQNSRLSIEKYLSLDIYKPKTWEEAIKDFLKETTII